jgi:hypothetical protein
MNAKLLQGGGDSSERPIPAESSLFPHNFRWFICSYWVMPLLLLLTFPALLQAQFTYTTNGGAITITKYTGPGGDVRIPDTITGLPVVSIGPSAFSGCTNLISVTISDSVIGIGDAAFESCSYMTSATIGTNVTTIGDSAFSFCPLTSVTIPNNVTSMGLRVFQGCNSLTNVTIGNGVTGIGDYAFFSCFGLTSIKIPNAVTNIGSDAFGLCGSLTSVTIPESVTRLGGGAFGYCNALTNITLPSSLTSIENGTFGACGSLANVVIPDSVTSIGDYAFEKCERLTNVIIGKRLTNLGYHAFSSCQRLTGVYFQGNPPRNSVSVFDSGGQATLYYLPGTIGWGATFGGLPTALWNPQPQSVGLQSNEFGFTITGTTNIPIVVEASANLASPSWIPLQTCTLTNGSNRFSDPAWTNFPARFYRIRSP